MRSTCPVKLKEGNKTLLNLLTASDRESWQPSQRCDSCFLKERNDSILCGKNGLYLIYAQVTFSSLSSPEKPKSVILIRNARLGRDKKTLVEGTFPHASKSSVWVAKIITLKDDDSISINITGDFLRDITYWGAVELRWVRILVSVSD